MKHILTLITITATLALGACSCSKPATACGKPAAGACTKGAKPDACCKSKAGAKKM